MKKKILIIGHADNRTENFIQPVKNAGAIPIVWRADKDPSPNIRFDAVIVTGGPANAHYLTQTNDAFFSQEIVLLNKCLHNNTPVLGVCLGHQLLALLIGGEVTLANRWEIGWQKQRLTESGEKDALFKGLPNSMDNFEFHQDLVTKLPQNAKLLAISGDHNIEAFRLIDQPVWGIQFHPEIDNQIARIIFKKEQARLKKLNLDLNELIAEGDNKYKPDHLTSILSNFINQLNQI